MIGFKLLIIIFKVKVIFASIILEKKRKVKTKTRNTHYYIGNSNGLRLQDCTC